MLRVGNTTHVNINQILFIKVTYPLSLEFVEISKFKRCPLKDFSTSLINSIWDTQLHHRDLSR